jgi:hypothetical protein
MPRYIFRYTGRGDPSQDDLAVIRDWPGVTVVDSSPRMLLIQAPVSVAAELAERLTGWVSTPEQKIPVPDTRPRVRPVAG